MPTLEFKGKQHVYAHHLTVPYRCLLPDTKQSVNPADNDDNLIIHGDNLHALKALLPRYAARIKCIYIDPPYNTGNEGWVYNDNVNSPLMKEWLKANKPVDGEDLERHEKWLCMMWPRLHLLRELLSDDGVIFVSIDDNEQHHLKGLMDEIFGPEHFFARIVWESRTKPTNMGPARFNIQSNTESILVYGNKSMKEHAGFNLYPSTEKAYPYQDERGTYRKSEFQQRRNIGSLRRDTMVYPICGISPRNGYRWQVSPGRFEELREQDLLVIEGERIFEKIYSDTEEGSAYEPFWGFVSKEIGTAESAKLELNEILGLTHGMETLKPTDLIKKLVFHATDTGDIVLDSFAGSGTTAQAVLLLNKKYKSNRKFILIECEDYASAITAERVRRVINGVPNATDDSLKEGLGGSFTYCTLGDPIDLEGMLTGKNLPEYGELAAYLLHVSAGISVGTTDLQPKNNDGLFYIGDTKHYHLLYQANREHLESNGEMLYEDRAQRIGDAAHEVGKTAVVFGPGKYIGQRELSNLGITFCQLPYEIHRNG